ncbi:MAG TPA: hypothetical protein VFZ17_12290 [Acidimicrobiia bacterium]|nr:hypothetical protein [Acidimicrobiia bacterium]
MTAANADHVHIEANGPWFPNLAEVMDEDPGLLDALANEDRAGRDRWSMARFTTEDLPLYVLDRQLSASETPLPFRSAAWLMLLVGYWGGIATQEAFASFGTARGADELGVTAPRTLSADDFERIHDWLARAHDALAGTIDDQIALLDELLRLETQIGVVFGAAYTVGFYVPTLQPPPVGAKPDHLAVDSEMVVCSADRILEVEYKADVPRWLTEWRARQEGAHTAMPDRWESVITGGTEQADLRDLWARGFEVAAYNWGADSLQGWTDAAFVPMLEMNLKLTFQVEAVAHAAVAALVTREPEAVRRALQASFLMIPSWLGTAVGIGDTSGTRPRGRPATA